jgi:phosphohistidine phosphatase
MRHAQKDESQPDLYDYDVELTAKGIEDTKKVSMKLKEKDIIPDLIVSSPAIRARQTVEIASKTLGYKKNIMYNEVIYQAFLNEFMESITYTFDTVDTLLVIGHNPALTSLCITYTEFKEEIKMAEVVKIEFNCNSWISIDKNNAKFIEIIKP